MVSFACKFPPGCGVESLQPVTRGCPVKDEARRNRAEGPPLIPAYNAIADAFSRCKRWHGLASGMNIPAFHIPLYRSLPQDLDLLTLCIDHRSGKPIDATAPQVSGAHTIRIFGASGVLVRV